MKKIALGWFGLPKYAEDLLVAGINELQVNYEVSAVACRLDNLFQDAGKQLGSKLKWVENVKGVTWESLGMEIPDVFFEPSFIYPCFISLANQVKRNGGRVVGLFDSCWKGSLKQFIARVMFKMFLRDRFDMIWVPGSSGRRLARYYGFADSEIVEGLYGISNQRFNAGCINGEREKVFCFVGQLIERKGVKELIRAFKRFRATNSEWRLKVFGCGPLENLVHGTGIEAFGFQQPDIIAEHLKKSKFLLLPSRSDHWPLVVCEAAHAGCGILISDQVGNRFEFVSNENGIVFKAKDEIAILKTMTQAVNGRFDDCAKVANVSMKLAQRFVPSEWGKEVKSICDILTKVTES